jgi:hypothetical protein
MRTLSKALAEQSRRQALRAVLGGRVSVAHL